MAQPVITLELDEGATRIPLAQRIARSIARDVRRGRLSSGTRLPGSRQLAQSLGVHRNTVIAAYEELEREGYVETRAARGTFVADSVPNLPARRFQGPTRPTPLTLALAPELPPERSTRTPSNTLPLLGGLSDLRFLPRATLARAYRSALRDKVDLTDYGEPLGDARLLAALTRLLAERRGVRAADGELLVTRGAQMALYLAARALVHPGAVIAVEALGYRPAWESFRLAGAEIVPIPVDRSGLVVEKLAALTQSRRVAAVYLTPHHQYPTTVTLSAPRRLSLLRLAIEQRMAILEDDYDHEMQFVGRPVLPLASADEARVVVYIGTLSKVLAPGLRIGYVAAQAPVIDAMRRLRLYFDRQGDHTVERAVAYLIEDGELEAHIRRTRRAYADRRELLMHELRAKFDGLLSFKEPSGGMALWTQVHGNISADAWARNAAERGVLVQPGKYFGFDGRTRPNLRLGYARLNEAELTRAVQLLQKSVPR